ncbi:MAG: hypothetical protein F4Y74_07740 [Gemmatimonadales bacterium]|nr:hypothetical protein [Gemmatimonadales bacterium]MYG18538.1 hypothetical protein [Gemmatimonadales bacterium]MYH09948.1 hypothetical protein [Gemmatimonadales bacterium]MYL06286.1 hypothetical protein [Gemmatimonadales bacterium]
MYEICRRHWCIGIMLLGLAACGDNSDGVTQVDPDQPSISGTWNAVLPAGRLGLELRERDAGVVTGSFSMTVNLGFAVTGPIRSGDHRHPNVLLRWSAQLPEASGVDLVSDCTIEGTAGDNGIWITGQIVCTEAEGVLETRSGPVTVIIGGINAPITLSRLRIS